HVESRLARAAVAMDSANWDEARAELDALAKGEGGPGRRACLMMARLERAETGNEDAARDWILTAETAPEDDRWHCTACAAAREQWSLTCPECYGLATLVWGPPPPSDTRADARAAGAVGNRSLLAGLGGSASA
ncbi:MAG: hypothetical protein WEB93_00070, partial [Sphingomonadales bacterium]